MRAATTKEVKENFKCGPAQINFDSELITDLRGIGKVNRLAVMAVQETEKQLLSITKTTDATGKTYILYIVYNIYIICINYMYLYNIYIH